MARLFSSFELRTQKAHDTVASYMLSFLIRKEARKAISIIRWFSTNEKTKDVVVSCAKETFRAHVAELYEKMGFFDEDVDSMEY